MAEEARLAVESIAGQRPYQEDSVLAETLSDGRLVVAVADGMGGHAAGEVASALALETLVAALEDGTALDDAFVKANHEVHEKAREPGKQGMGTTLVAAVIEDGEYFVANVGDSRGYLLEAQGIRQITDDHSFVAEAVKRGQSHDEAMRSPFRDALTRSIGTEARVDVDVFGPFPVRDDSALLLCSDGLYKTLSDEDLRRIYAGSGSPRGAAQTLVNEALDNGSDDNISVVIAEYGEVPRTVSQGTMPIDFVAPADRPDTDATAAAETVDPGRDADATVPVDAVEGPGDVEGPTSSDSVAADPAATAPLEAVPPAPAPAEVGPIGSDAQVAAGSSGLPAPAIAVIAVVVLALLAMLVL